MTEKLKRRKVKHVEAELNGAAATAPTAPTVETAHTNGHLNGHSKETLTRLARPLTIDNLKFNPGTTQVLHITGKPNERVNIQGRFFNGEDLMPTPFAASTIIDAAGVGSILITYPSFSKSVEGFSGNYTNTPESKVVIYKERKFTESPVQVLGESPLNGLGVMFSLPPGFLVEARGRTIHKLEEKTGVKEVETPLVFGFGQKKTKYLQTKVVSEQVLHPLDVSKNVWRGDEIIIEADITAPDGFQFPTYTYRKILDTNHAEELKEQMAEVKAERFDDYAAPEVLSGQLTVENVKVVDIKGKRAVQLEITGDIFGAQIDILAFNENDSRLIGRSASGVLVGNNAASRLVEGNTVSDLGLFRVEVGINPSYSGTALFIVEAQKGGKKIASTEFVHEVPSYQEVTGNEPYGKEIEVSFVKTNVPTKNRYRVTVSGHPKANAEIVMSGAYRDSQIPGISRIIRTPVSFDENGHAEFLVDLQPKETLELNSQTKYLAR